MIDAMNLHDRKQGGLLTPYLTWDEMAWQKEGQHHPHTVDHESDEVAWQKWQCHSQTGDHGRRCHETIAIAWQNKWQCHSHTIGQMLDKTA
jgi:hypothetical protein